MPLYRQNEGTIFLITILWKTKTQQKNNGDNFVESSVDKIRYQFHPHIIHRKFVQKK